MNEELLRDCPEEKNRIEPGTLYLVATPIGNLADLSGRAVKTLCGVDFIAAEDTRVTAKLLAHIGVSKPMIPYHAHNQRSCGETIVARLREGESCALVTDAGSPVISDPGEDIARLCEEQGVAVTVIPGPCAAICALMLSGLNARRFSFEGFLEGTPAAQRERLTLLRSDDRTMIFYASPHDLTDTLSLMREILGNRRIALCREMTKRNEEIQRTDLDGALREYASRPPRGEYVLVVEGGHAESEFWAEMSAEEHVAFYEGNGMRRMDAIKAVARDRGVAKNVIYRQLLPEEPDEKQK